MLSVILTILKIIGIILLVILGLVLTALLIVLFVPVRYKAEGIFARTDEGFKEEMQVRVTWLMHILSVTFNLKDMEPELAIRVFGRKLSAGGDKAVPKKHKPVKSEYESKKRMKTPRDSQEEKEACGQEKMYIYDCHKEDKPQNTSDSKEGVKNDNIGAESKKAVKNVSLGNKDIDKKEKKSIKEKLIGLLNRINAICEKIKNISAIKDSFIEYLRQEEAKLAIRGLKDILLKVLKHILPQKLHAKLKFGFEDPATTGKILGVASVLYGVYGDNLELEPDFDNVILEGEYKLKGRIRTFTLLIAALKIYFNKWLREFIAFSKETVKNI